MVNDVAPRWLTDEQSEAWFGLAGILIWLPAALDAQLQRDAGVSHVEYQVLAALSMNPGHKARMSTVAAYSNINPSHLSRVAARLEAHGWIQRRPDPEDGRCTLATLTSSGLDKVVASAPGHVEAVQKLVFDNLTSAQVRQLRDIGHRVMNAVKPGADHLPDAMRRP